jgi:hypothetical protein
MMGIEDEVVAPANSRGTRREAIVGRQARESRCHGPLIATVDGKAIVFGGAGTSGLGSDDNHEGGRASEKD